MEIDVRQLRLVAELKSTGSATAAADRLGVTQSAVSHQLRELEGRLGCPVCSRVGKRLVLTAAGHRLLRGAGGRGDQGAHHERPAAREPQASPTGHFSSTVTFSILPVNANGSL